MLNLIVTTLGMLIAMGTGAGIAIVIAWKLEDRRNEMFKIRKKKGREAAIKRLNELATQYKHDPLQWRSRADGVLCGLLMQLGCSDVVDAYEATVEQGDWT